MKYERSKGRSLPKAEDIINCVPGTKVGNLSWLGCLAPISCDGEIKE